MRITALVGSPRRDGNTEVLVDRVIDGVNREAPGAMVEKIRIADLRLEPCRGTLACRKTGVCVIRDDRREVIEKLKRSDGLILGTPIYRRYLPGQVKVFFDRLMPLEREMDMGAGGGGMEKMKAMMKFVPAFIQRRTVKRMMAKMYSLVRLEKKIMSVAVIVGGHPGELAFMKDDMAKVRDELSFLSLLSGGRVVDSVKAAGFMEAGSVRRDRRLLERAHRAGKALAESLTAV